MPAQNDMLSKWPLEEEIKEAFFQLDRNNAAVQMGFDGHFFTVLPDLIYEEQSGFMRGRNIIDKVVLAQELVYDISKSLEFSPTYTLKGGFRSSVASHCHINNGSAGMDDQPSGLCTSSGVACYFQSEKENLARQGRKKLFPLLW
ncbi:hypothetical protein O6P43_032211 [Quillaja saponaria]|uniref:Uncharacterized protein n=1 Tax=Quillaja saponaria TaxID=32244 RepID=A0AAD7KYD9_QUISA|nr:hypothetical protein O6P43_032211 [Quillaja saponaria]